MVICEKYLAWYLTSNGHSKYYQFYFLIIPISQMKKRRLREVQKLLKVTLLFLITGP